MPAGPLAHLVALRASLVLALRYLDTAQAASEAHESAAVSGAVPHPDLLPSTWRDAGLSAAARLADALRHVDGLTGGDAPRVEVRVLRSHVVSLDAAPDAPAQTHYECDVVVQGPAERLSEVVGSANIVAVHDSTEVQVRAGVAVREWAASAWPEIEAQIIAAFGRWALRSHHNPLSGLPWPPPSAE